MNLKERNVVNGECNMIKYYSIGIKLDDVVKDENIEQTILENIRRCSKLTGKTFQVEFWHKDLSEEKCKEFVRRNEKLLFEVNT